MSEGRIGRKRGRPPKERGRPRRTVPRMATMVRTEPDLSRFLMERCRTLGCSRQDLFVSLLDQERIRIEEGLKR